MTVVLGNKERDTERFRLMLHESVTVVDTPQKLFTYVDEHPDDDLVVIGPDASMAAAADFADQSRLTHSTLGVVLMRNRVEVGTMSQALRAGVREVVAADDAEALLSACRRSLAVSEQLRSRQISSDAPARGKIILIFASKGGCGKTTVATNLAATLADQSGGTGGKVCLVDFDLAFGDVGICLQIDPVRTISDALAMQGSIDAQAVASLVIPYRPNFDVLLAPVKPTDAEFISADLAADVLRNLALIYDYVVVDSPSAFNDVTLRCFDIADTFVLITSLDVPALKNYKVALDTLDTLGFPRSKWQIVLNRCDSRVGLVADDVERTIGVPISVLIPSSRDVPASLNAGVTLATVNPKHPVSRAIHQLAEKERGHLRAVGEPKRKRRFGIFRRSA